MTIARAPTTCLSACAAPMLMAFAAGPTWAHCDTLDGPVVHAARAALDQADLTPVLRWVKQDHEPDVRAAFDLALAARAQGDAARQLADRFFSETVVRVHRQGEGAPYTGLRPAGSVDPAIAAADEALETGSADALAEQLARAMRDALLGRFAMALEKKAHAGQSVAAGREYVAAYVGYIHFVEALQSLALHGAAEHEVEPSPGAGHEH